MTAAGFSWIFVAALAVSLIVRLWLARRQIAHVTARRQEVPAAFASRIGLAAHQKAADYTVAKQQLGIVETMVDAVVLWWLWVWLAWLGFQVLMLVLFPTVIAPLFNKFSPLPAGAARERIEQLLARCDFAARGLFVVDGSRRSGHGNAYFTGFGRARRVVFFDTLLARLAPEAVEAVLAHELGHFKLRHVAKRVAWSAVLSLAFLALLAWLATTSWFYAGLGIPAQAVDIAMTRPGVA